MIHTHGAPPELWTVARDLWTLRLSVLTARLGDDTVPSNPNANQASDHDDQPNTTDAETSAQESDHPRVPGPALTHSPALIDTLSTIILSLTLLHFPLPLYRLYKLVLDLHIIYIRALRHLPSAMTQRLPPEYHPFLDTISIPRPEDLPRATHTLMQAYSDTFAMQFPAINWPLMLHAYLEKLALPIEVYAAVKKLRELVGFEFRWEVDVPQPDKDQDSDTEPRRIRKRRSPVAWPEAQLMSLLIVAVKLLFPLRDQADTKLGFGKLRLKMDWMRWLEIRSSHDAAMKKRDKGKASTFLETTDRDVQDMSGEELDGYMDWFQELYAERDEDVVRMAKGREAIVNELLKTFPVQKAPPKTSDVEPEQESERDTERKIIIAVQQSLRIDHDTVTEDKSAGIGDQAEESMPQAAQKSTKSYYPIFSVPDDLAGRDNEAARRFHEQTAQESCLTLRQLLRAVVYTEKRLLDWADTRRREEVFEEPAEDSSPGDEPDQGNEVDDDLDLSSMPDTTEMNTG